MKETMIVKFKQRANSGIFCHNLLKKAIDFTLPELLSPPEYSNLRLIVSMKQKAGKGVRTIGTCVPDFTLEIGKKKFEIALNHKFILSIDKNLPKLDQVSTLIHELVHVKQYVRRELGLSVDGSFRWENRKAYDYKKYENSPWEKEAYFLEKEIFLEFVNQHSDDKEISRLVKHIETK